MDSRFRGNERWIKQPSLHRLFHQFGLGFGQERIAGFAVLAVCAHQAWANVLQYLVPLAATGWSFSELFRQRVTRFIALKPLSGSTSPMGARA